MTPGKVYGTANWRENPENSWNNFENAPIRKGKSDKI